jgi:hypothetical protein
MMMPRSGSNRNAVMLNKQQKLTGITMSESSEIDNREFGLQDPMT